MVKTICVGPVQVMVPAGTVTPPMVIVPPVPRFWPVTVTTVPTKPEVGDIPVITGAPGDGEPDGDGEGDGDIVDEGLGDGEGDGEGEGGVGVGVGLGMGLPFRLESLLHWPSTKMR